MLPTRRAAAALVAASLLLVGCDGEATSSPGRLQSLLARVPATVAAERVLYYTDLDAGAGGFGSVLPLRDAGAVLGADAEAITDVLETGGLPLTVLAGDVDPERVAAAAAASGYDVRPADEGWVSFRRSAAPPAGAPPLVTAVPAGAARDGLLVLGAARDVDAVVGGALPPAWARSLAGSLGEAVSVALDGREDPFEDAAHRHGTDVEGLLAQHQVTEPLAAYRAAALTWDPAGEFDGVAAEAGVIALAVADGVDGHEVAAALAVRAATAPVLGEQRRATSDLVEGGAPRFDPEQGVVRLPIRWQAFRPAELRADLEAGRLLFLAPGPATG